MAFLSAQDTTSAQSASGANPIHDIDCKRRILVQRLHANVVKITSSSRSGAIMRYLWPVLLVFLSLAMVVPVAAQFSGSRRGGMGG